MKKAIIAIASLFVFFALSPIKVSAVECCPNEYTYDTTTNRCYVTTPHGRVYVDSGCTTYQVCENNQCVDYQEPTIPTGCSSVSTGRIFCMTATGGHGSIDIYCSTTTECDEYKTAYETRPGTSPVDDFPTCNTNGQSGIDTAIGCIPIENPSALMAFILRWAIGVGGGIAFLLILVAGFQIITSAGNPERLKAGQELMTSAIAGLIMLIFSVFILRIIGVDILKLPGF